MTNYTRGRSNEYRAIKALEKDGWFCSRSAGSHSPVDIFAGKNGITLLVQVKSGKARASASDLSTLQKWAHQYGARAEVWTFKPHRPLVREPIA
jgi:Holliday junction resolvase